MPVKRILKTEDIIEIATFFTEKMYGDNIHIEIEVPDQVTMDRISEDFYYKNNKDKGEGCEYGLDELIVNVGGVKFRYFVKND